MQSKGFTLMELMIVIAIIGILATLALPAYLDYLKRSQVVEAFSLASGYKSQLIEYYSTSGHCPMNAGPVITGGIPRNTDITGTYIKSVTLGYAGDYDNPDNCSIIVAFKDGFVPVISEPLLGLAIMIKDRPNAGSFEWVCQSTLPQKFLPSSCDGGVAIGP